MKSRHFGKYSNNNNLNYSHADAFTNGFESVEKVVMTSFALLASVAIFYCSLFYIPAYLGSTGVARYFNDLEHEPTLNAKVEADTVKSVSWYSPYMDLLRLRRGYFKAEQVLNVQYLLSEPGTLKLDIHRCSGPVIVEILHCNIVDTISLTREDSIKGDLSLSITKNGFYRMSETAVNKDGKNLAYSIIWRRQ